MDKFDLAKMPSAPVDEVRPAMPPDVQRQVQEVRQVEPRLSNAMATVQPDRENRLNSTVFENDSVKVSAIGKVAGLNLKGRF